MKVIVGLGNPGKKYENTRHNIGFIAIDYLKQSLVKEGSINHTAKFNSIITEIRIDDTKIILVKPLTYMNLSGEAVKPVLSWYKVPIEDLIIIYDDLDLPTGKIRFREKGSSGGHNGIKSIIQHLGTEDFKRIKIGIDRPVNMSVADYVLTPFKQDEKIKIEQSINIINEAVIAWIKGMDFKKIMSLYH